MESSNFWEDSSVQHMKYESASTRSCKEEQSIFRYCDGNLNFSTAANSEDDEYGSYHKKKVSRDPMSHRIIEKRRRDRMNNCLADLSRLIPAEYLKKGRGRIEKTEIIEMAIKHMKHLQAHACRQLESCELVQQQQQHQQQQQQQQQEDTVGGPIVHEHYRLGYQECLSEAMHFLVEVEGFFAGDPLCVQLINHLQKHCDKILKGDRLNFPRTHNGETTSTSSSSSGYGHPHSGVANGSSSSPTSGSCSDSGRADSKEHLGILPSAPQPVPALPAGMPEDSCYEENLMNLSGPSQLREMLTSPNLTTLSTAAVSSRMQLSSAATQPLSSPVPSASTTEHNNVGANGTSSAASLYKFKNNIKQRFSAEHHNEDTRHDSAMTGSGNMKRKRYASDVNGRELMPNGRTGVISMMTSMKRRDSETCSIPSSPPSPPHMKYPPPSPSPDVPNTPPPLPQRANSAMSAYGVPIFALHTKGSFYIPLTVDAEILTPYLAALGLGSSDSNSSSNIVLHPVTISVNFQQAAQSRTAQPLQPMRHIPQCQPLPSWKSEINNYGPLAKWTV